MWHVETPLRGKIYIHVLQLLINKRYPFVFNRVLLWSRSLVYVRSVIIFIIFYIMIQHWGATLSFYSRCPTQKTFWLHKSNCHKSVSHFESLSDLKSMILATTAKPHLLSVFVLWLWLGSTFLSLNLWTIYCKISSWVLNKDHIITWRKILVSTFLLHIQYSLLFITTSFSSDSCLCLFPAKMVSHLFSSKACGS